MHRRGDPGGGPATIAVRSAIRRDYDVIDLRTLRYAVREQHLDATHTYRQTPPVPEGAANFGLIGQYVEVSRDVAFTIEYSARTAWEAIHLLLKRGPAPPPVYQAQYDPKALFAALKVFVQ